MTWMGAGNNASILEGQNVCTSIWRSRVGRREIMEERGTIRKRVGSEYMQTKEEKQRAMTSL